MAGLQNEAEIKLLFQQLQQKFIPEYKADYDDTMAAKTVIVIPSLTMDAEILSKINGIVHYEERLLCMLLLLRMPNTHLVYVTSTPIDPVIIDYYLHLLPGITGHHARQRLHFFSCYDASSVSLTEKILARPRLIQRIKHAVPNKHTAHMACFNVTPFERQLAVKLGYPIYGCDPDLLYWGTKSGSREIFEACGLLMPPGYCNLKNENEVIVALAQLYKSNPSIRKAVVKMNDGFSGEGNGVFSFHRIVAGLDIEMQLRNQLPLYLDIVAKDLSYVVFMEKLTQMGGIAEAFVDGEEKISPSVQCRIDPEGKAEVLSTHDQMMGGKDGQVFLGGTFPADSAYNVAIGELGKVVAEALQKKGVLGRFAVDFLSVKENGKWKHYAIEINLRKGGTTHPYIMLEFLTNGKYDAPNGKFVLADGMEKFYLFTDNLQDDRFKGLTPYDLMEIAICNGLHYDHTKEEGVMFHLIGALSQFGKIGLVCVASSMDRAKYFYEQTLKILEKESQVSM